MRSSIIPLEPDSATAKRITCGKVTFWVAFTSGGPLKRSFGSKKEAEAAAKLYEDALSEAAVTTEKQGDEAEQFAIAEINQKGADDLAA
jgi:hypothetical protein